VCEKRHKVRETEEKIKISKTQSRHEKSGVKHGGKFPQQVRAKKKEIKKREICFSEKRITI
jgi:hypothetical protein